MFFFVPCVVSILKKVRFTFSYDVICTLVYLSPTGSVRKLRIKPSFVVQLQSIEQELEKPTEVKMLYIPKLFSLWLLHLSTMD